MGLYTKLALGKVKPSPSGKKKSGLTDSPFFEESTNKKTKTEKQKSERMSEGANEQKHNRSNEQTSERAIERMSEGARVSGDSRATHRFNADLFLDQLEFIEDLIRSRRRVSKKSTGKAEILREMVDFFINNKK